MIENKQLTYKETGLDWMPEVPEHWKMVRLKYITKYQKGKVPKVFSDDTSLFPYLAMDYLRGKAEVIQYVEPNEELKLVENDEILILWDGANAGEILKSKKDYISSTMAVIEPDEKYFIKDFFYYFLKSHEKDLKQLSTGTTIPHLNQDYLFGSHFYTPPKDEQDEIVQYIKAQEEKINLFIQKKQRFIELLKEQRQIVIHQLVTKGLNQKVKLKSSDIEWLGDIPSHWEIRRLKECLIGKLKYGANESGEEYNPTWYRYIRITDFNIDGKLSEENKLSLPLEIGAEYELQDGDILFARSGATVGKTFQFHYVSEEEKYCYAGYLIKATPDENIILSDFLFNYTNSKAFENWKNSIFNKATIENIGADKYSVLKIPIPPIEEQKQIVSHIKTETATIDTAIAKAEREIELIREYKEAMIAEAVMGKVLNRIK